MPNDGVAKLLLHYGTSERRGPTDSSGCDIGLVFADDNKFVMGTGFIFQCHGCADYNAIERWLRWRHYDGAPQSLLEIG